MTGCELHVAQRHAGIECCHDERTAEHVRMNESEAGPLADRSHPSIVDAASTRCSM